MPLAIDISPAQGDIVRIRSRRYLVEQVTPAVEPCDDTLVYSADAPEKVFALSTVSPNSAHAA